jgi:hypothetical protein
LYGSIDASKNWDDTLSEWLINGFGCIRCPGAGSIFIKREGSNFLFILNAVDDQLYFSNSDDFRKNYEVSVDGKFKIEMLGQAHWYLQARISQLQDYSIILDQSRYIALIVSRFLPSKPLDQISEEDKKKYLAPLPADFVATSKDKSEDVFALKKLQEEFGFQYSSAIGMLIFLMNTAMGLQFAVRKLAKFNALPGKKHFKAVLHLLNHLRVHKSDYGIKFYSNPDESPITQLCRTISPDFDKFKFPIVTFYDSSWQDCPDTSRSTGSYFVFVRGSLVDGASFVPTPIALSSAESEYNAGAHATTGSAHIRQIHNSFHGRDPDALLTIPMIGDSTSAIAIASNERDTRHTRHILRRIHFVRHAIADHDIAPYKVDGTLNPADVGTKVLCGSVYWKLCKMFQVTVSS